MFNMGFNGQFGGGFLQSPGAGIVQAPPGAVVYAMNWNRQKKARDDSQRDRYGTLESWRLAFPTSTGQQDPEESMKRTFQVGPIWFHPGAGWRERRYR
jgi:hypothetical protein